MATTHALGPADLTAFLNHLAAKRRASASTQNQALCTVIFLYRHVLGRPMPEFEGPQRARRPKHLPAVLSRREVLLFLHHLNPFFRLVAHLLDGSASGSPSA